MASRKHDFTKAEILSGAMVLLSVVVLAGFIAMVNGLRPPEEVTAYYATFTNIVGLNTGADVRFGGVKVGRVTRIEPDPEDQTLIRVEASIRPDIPVNKASVATIEQTSLTADKHLAVSTGEKDAPRLAAGERLKSVTKSGGLIEMPDLDEVVEKVKDLLGDVRDFLGVEEAKNREASGEQEFAKLNRIAADIREALGKGNEMLDNVTGILEDRKPDVENILKKVTEIEDSAKEMVDQLNGILKENRQPIKDGVAQAQDILEDAGKVVDGLSADLEKLMAALQKTLDNAEHLSENAKGFVDRNRGMMEDMVRDLRETIRYLRDFSRTMAQQPQSVIWGATPEGRKN